MTITHPYLLAGAVVGIAVLVVLYLLARWFGKGLPGGGMG